MAKKQHIGSTELLAAYVRRDIVDMTHRGGSSHVGSGLSIADILAVLYGDILSVAPFRAVQTCERGRAACGYGRLLQEFLQELLEDGLKARDASSGRLGV